MTNEERRGLQLLIAEARKAALKPEPRLNRYSSDPFCASCGCHHDNMNKTCPSCRTRHSKRRKAKLSNALPSYRPGECVECGCDYENHTNGCKACTNRFCSRRKRALHQRSRPLTAKTDDGHVRVSLSGATSGGTQQQEAA